MSHSPPVDRRALLAVGALVGCCLLWGYSFPTMQIATSAMEHHTGGGDDRGIVASRAMFNGIRFTLAAAIYGLLTMRRQRGFQSHEVLGGFVVGCLFAGGMLLQVLGLRWALPSVSGFLTSLAVVFAPLGQAIVLRKPVHRIVWVSVGLALLGTVVLSMPNPGAKASNTHTAIPPVLFLGEILTVASAMFFTGQILAVDRFGQRADSTRLTLISLATTGLLSLATGLATGGPQIFGKAFYAAAVDPTLWWTLATLVLLSSVLAIHLMNAYQPYVSAAAASVIYCTEPLFAALFSVMFRTEELTRNIVLGGAITVAAVIVLQRDRTRQPKTMPS